MPLPESNSSNYKRIAKNAAILYIRMLLIIIITLYTSRIILQTLGVEDFGIYNVVAGFVAMIGFLNNAMTSSTQRFLSFELGKTEDSNVQEVFNMSINIHLIIALVTLVLGEIIGIWFIETKLNIPLDRLDAAKWVFHFSLFAFMINIITVPYKALVIANEKMNVFSLISIFDVIFKLLAVFMLSKLGMDKLILFALLSFIVVVLTFVLYKVYVKNYLPDSNYEFNWNQKLFKVILSFTGWNLWGNIAFILNGQGVNLLLNIFFGPVVNASRAIAMEVSSGLNSFVSSLQVALNPQIVKSYVAQDMKYMHQLVYYGAKYNFLLLFFLSMPVLINTEAVLSFWLGLIPEYAPIFVRLIIINILIDCISAPLMISAQATGKIRLYQSLVASILLLNLPLSYLLLKQGYQPESVVYIGICTSIIALLVRLLLLRKLIQLSIISFFKNVVFRILLVVISVVSVYYMLLDQYIGRSNFWWDSVIISMSVFCAVIIFGIDRLERRFLLMNLKKLSI